MKPKLLSKNNRIPTKGELVEVSDDGKNWHDYYFVKEIDGDEELIAHTHPYACVFDEKDANIQHRWMYWKIVRTKDYIE